MGFSFTATAQCDYCGQLLGSSDEECDHDGMPVDKRVFRRIGEGRDSLVGVEAASGYKWNKLAETIGDDWIAYEYLGTKDHVNTMMQSPLWESVADIPKISMSIASPDDLREDYFNEETDE